MFTKTKRQETSAYYEFQYCKEFLPSKILVKPEHYGKHFLADSLLVHIDDDELLSSYLNYLTPTHSPDGTECFFAYGVNYYDREQTLNILKRIFEDKPIEYQILADWLEKAVTEYNGFYFLGV